VGSFCGLPRSQRTMYASLRIAKTRVLHSSVAARSRYVMQTHSAPSPNTTYSARFCTLGSFSTEIGLIGIRINSASVIIFGICAPKYSAVRSKHFPGLAGFQTFDTGRQVTAQADVMARPQRMMTKPMAKHCRRVEWRGKRRKYMATIESFVKVMQSV
jgi:hypothetical protein